MNRLTLNFIIENTAGWMSTEHTDFSLLKKGGKKGARKNITFVKRRDENRCVWIKITGDNSETLLVIIYWAQRGDSFDDLNNLSEEEANATRGWIQLMDSELIDDDLPFDGGRLLYLGDPPLEIVQAAIAEWHKTDIFTRERQLLALQMKKKNPAVTDEEIDAEQYRCHLISFQSWSAIEMALKLNEEQLKQVTDGLLRKIQYHLDKHALPFLETKLS
jgi:hypothetical protein